MRKLLGLGLILLLAGCGTYSSNPLFPDPCVVSAPDGKITFTDLPALCTIEVYTLSGVLACSTVESDGDGQLVWDLRNESGEILGSGLYNYLIKSAQDTKSGKLIITR
jgi:hypothetical protein